MEQSRPRTIRFPHWLEDKLQELARKDRRKFSTYVLKVLAEHAEQDPKHR